MHPWHDITPGEKSPSVVNGIIEIPRGTKAKYEVDKSTGLLKLDRVLHGSFHYPVNYGFIPQTLGEDGDPLDILVISQVDIEPLCLVHAKVIGLMQMIDQGISDEKVLAVAMGDGAVNRYESVADLPAHLITELKHFFEHYTRLENKKVEVQEFLPAIDAHNAISVSMERYRKKFPA